MTVPEENRPKTDSTDETLERRAGERPRTGREGEPGRGGGSTMREALRDADVKPEDYDRG